MSIQTAISRADINEMKMIFRLASGLVETDRRLDGGLKRHVSLVLDEALEILFLFEIDALSGDDPFSTLNATLNPSAFETQENPSC